MGTKNGDEEWVALEVRSTRQVLSLPCITRERVAGCTGKSNHGKGTYVPAPLANAVGT